MNRRSVKKHAAASNHTRGSGQSRGGLSVPNAWSFLRTSSPGSRNGLPKLLNVPIVPSARFGGVICGTWRICAFAEN